MPKFKNLTTGVVENVSAPEVVKLMEKSDNYQKIGEKAKKEDK